MSLDFPEMAEMHPARLIPPIVKHGLISQDDWKRLQVAIDSNDLQAFVEVAIPLCQDNVPLFALLFLKFDDMPHIYAEWSKVRKHNRILIRLPRSFGKTQIFTFATIIHRVCYSVVPNSIHEDPRILALFETRDRANDRMLVVRQLFESGGPGGLIGQVFRGPAGTAWAGMSIPEIASRFGEWNNRTISLPHPRGLHKPDPNVRSLSPGEATVGFHPKIILADDLVGQKTAGSQKRRETLSKWFNEAIVPMFRPYTKFWAPHTLFHDDDLNRELEKREVYYTMILTALNRFPDREDFTEVRDEMGILTGIELTRKGEELKSLWPCPTHTEANCPMTEAHMREVGEHRPVRSLILQWLENPLKFALQMMHIIRHVDSGSVKPWMLRFFCTDPNDRRIGTVATWHADWESWVEEYPDAGLARYPPKIVHFGPEGVTEEPKGPVKSAIERCVHGWDLAFGKLRTNDRTVCARMYRTTDKRYFTVFDKGRWKHDQVWRKIVLNAVTDPWKKPDEVALEVDAEQIYPQEVSKLMREMGVHDRFKLTEIRRTKDKDTVFQNSGLPVTMSNGFSYVDVDDEDAIMEMLSVTADQTGGHDDCLDAKVNAYGRIRNTTRMMPGFFSEPLPAR